MIIFIFEKMAKKKFFELPQEVQKRVKQKLTSLKEHENIFAILKRLEEFEQTLHRLRIGNYRLILHLGKQNKNNFEFWIIDIGHRKDIYK